LTYEIRQMRRKAQTLQYLKNTNMNSAEITSAIVNNNVCLTTPFVYDDGVSLIRKKGINSGARNNTTMLYLNSNVPYKGKL
jgi:hypothetical protein